MTGVGITDKKKRNTDNLCRELMEEPDIDTYIKKNQPFFADSSISDLLTEFYKRQKISKAELSRRAGMSEVYLHQVFAGQRRLSRDRLLCVCVGMSATLDETQGLLKECGFAQLYVKNRRDAVIMYGMLHGMDLEQINDRLFDAGEASLC